MDWRWKIGHRRAESSFRPMSVEREQHHPIPDREIGRLMITCYHRYESLLEFLGRWPGILCRWTRLASNRFIAGFLTATTCPGIIIQCEIVTCSSSQSHGRSRLRWQRQDLIASLAGRLASAWQGGSTWCIFDNATHAFAMPNARELVHELQITVPS